MLHLSTFFLYYSTMYDTSQPTSNKTGQEKSPDHLLFYLICHCLHIQYFSYISLRRFSLLQISFTLSASPFRIIFCIKLKMLFPLLYVPFPIPLLSHPHILPHARTSYASVHHIHIYSLSSPHFCFCSKNPQEYLPEYIL